MFPLFRGLLFLTLLGTCSAGGSDYRPVLLGKGKSSLVNLINTDTLMKQGQGSGLIMFTAVISTSGDTGSYFTRVYGGSRGTEALTKELIGKIDRAIFMPALYRGTPQITVVFGTVVFAVVDGKPHLRIFLNQEMEDLKRGSDFIGPQIVLVHGTKFREGIHYPVKAGGVSGTVAIRMNIDADGKILGQKLLYESPQNLDFGAQVMMDIKDATFLPGYRNGKPVSCSFTFPMIFKGVAGQQWSSD